MKRILPLLVFSMLITSLNAQKVEKLLVGQNGTPTFIKFNTKNKAQTLADSKSTLKTYVFTQQKDEIKAISTSKDNLGFTHEKYQQYYNGVKVEYGTYSINKRGGAIQTMNGEYVFINDQFKTTPVLSETAALQKAMSFIGAQKYMWQSANNEKFAKTSEKSGTYYPNAELVIVQNFLSTDKDMRLKPTLAYKFNIYAEKPLSRDFVYVNAFTGEIVHKNAIIKHCNLKNHNHSPENISEEHTAYSIKANANGSAATRYSGTRTIVADSFNGSYRLRETTRGLGIETYDMNTGTVYSNAVDFTDNDNNWTAAEHDNAQKDNAALDAHWGAEMTYDYWIQKHNRNSFDNSGAAIKSYVHYDVAYDNAYWNGTVMTYGDGSDTYFDALTSLDVAAHEIGHAICTNTANLTYSNESGAMNEGFSDIWGACVEFFAAPEKSRWLIGEDIERRAGYVALRSMSDPKSTGQPDTYLGTNWATGTADNGGVHTNSGVLNHWFYILSDGKTGTNDNGNAYSVTGLGIDIAAAIAYRTESVYLTANSPYSDARTFAIQSAEDLYGVGSNEVIQTTNAWYAVGVGAEYGTIAYCASKGNNFSYEWIAGVTVGSFTNTSAAAGYTDFTSQTVALNSGQSYAVSLVPGFASTAYNEYWKIWIDFNKDGDFADANELVFDAGALSNTTVTGTMAIPTVADVTTRMRVSMKYNAAQTECEAFSYGEVEDYTVSVTSSGVDTQAPTAPVGLASANVTETTVDLSWTASTDNVGVTGYDVYKDGVFYSTVTGTSATVTGLIGATSYSFYVVAKDAAGNLSTASSTISVTTNTPADTQAPTAPTGLASANVTETTVDLSWTASTDNVGVTGYDVYKGGVFYSTVTGTAATVTGLTAATAYSFYVTAKDAAGNVSAASSTVNVTTNTATDTQAPTAPTGLASANITETTVDLSWTASTDNVGVAGYDVYKDGTLYSTVTGTTVTVTGLTAATAYSFYVTANDAAGNVSAASSTVNVTTNTAADTQAPTAPTGLASANITETTVDLSWTASTDNVGVTGYDVYKDGVLYSTVTGTTVGITGLIGSTTYAFYVIAKDAAGNVSVASSTVNVTTLPPATNCYASAVTLSLTFDNYPAETSWDLKNSTGTVVASGSGYSTSGATITQVFTLVDDSYTFTINDSYGDGICCTYGSGSYSLTDANSTVIVTGGSFTSSEATNFCISGSVAPPPSTGMPTGYCASAGGNSSYEWIDLVQLGTINNTTGNDGGYADYTSMSTNLTVGTQYTINFSAGFASTSYTEFWEVWIDYNRDGDFADAGESVATGSSSLSTTLSRTFTVPTGVSVGTTKMRVSMKYNAAATSCEAFTYGEVEDYAVVLGTVAIASNSFAYGFMDGDELGNESASFTIYPVPARDYINIKMSDDVNVDITVYSAMGSVVKRELLQGTNRLKVSDLAPGVYTMKISDGNKHTLKKFIKK